MQGLTDDDFTFFDTESVELEDGWDDLDRRARNGRRAIEGHPTSEDGEEPDTAASDLISDILTALFGPAGTYTFGGERNDDGDAGQNAQAFLDRAFRSWEGDAEDYTREPEPGEYGHEEAS